MPTLAPELIPLTIRSGLPSAELEDAELHAVGRAAVDGPSEVRAIRLEDFFDQDRMQVGDPVADAALLDERSDDLHVAEFQELLLQCPQAGGVNAVIVGEKNLQWLGHAFSPFQLSAVSHTGRTLLCPAVRRCEGECGVRAGLNKSRRSGSRPSLVTSAEAAPRPVMERSSIRSCCTHGGSRASFHRRIESKQSMNIHPSHVASDLQQAVGPTDPHADECLDLH